MNVFEHINLSGRRKLPVVFASEAAECGLACIAMIARYHGHDVDLNGLRQRFALSLSGISLRYLMALADQLDFSSRPLRVDLAALHKVQAPAILHWDLNHFVVLRSVSANAAIIHDPALGVRKLLLSEVSKHFTGVVLELSPAQQAVFSEISDELARNGFEAEPFGARSVAVKLAPAGIEAAAVEHMLHECSISFRRKSNR